MLNHLDLIDLTEYKQEIGSEAVDAYASRLMAHISCVYEAGLRLGLPESQVMLHDLSKWGPQQFLAYARYFQEGRDQSPVDSGDVGADMAAAWLDHIHKEPHHWEHWLFPAQGWKPDSKALDGNALPMPDRYALEMIADWQGASRVYTGSWDISEWLCRNAGRIILHCQTEAFVKAKLIEIGYPDVVFLQFGSEWI